MSCKLRKFQYCVKMNFLYKANVCSGQFHKAHNSIRGTVWQPRLHCTWTQHKVNSHEEIGIEQGPTEGATETSEAAERWRDTYATHRACFIANEDGTDFAMVLLIDFFSKHRAYCRIVEVTLFNICNFFLLLRCFWKESSTTSYKHCLPVLTSFLLRHHWACRI